MIQNQNKEIFKLSKNFFIILFFYLIKFLIFIGDSVISLFFNLFLLLKKIFLFFLWFFAKIRFFIKLFLIKSLSQIVKLFNAIKESFKRKIIFLISFLPSSIINVLLNFFSNFKIKFKYFILGISFSLFSIFIISSYQFIKNLPHPRLIGSINFPVSTKILDRNGKLLYEIYRDQNRTPVKLKDLPPYVIQATIAIEDKDFYKHQGVSPVGGIIRALKEIILTKNLQGGSTITQQLVKSALLTPERTIKRKIKEIILALWTERIFTKDQILEMYLNQVPYGGSSYGIEEASRTYFDKSAKDLTLSEAAFLAGLPQAPSLYSPYANPKLAEQRRNLVLEEMYHQKYIDQKSKIKNQKSKLEVKPLKTKIKAPHFVFYVKAYLEEKYGVRQVEEGGFRVVTSLDLDIQEKTEQILEEELKKVEFLNVSNGAVLITVPSTGEILAMVGSRDYYIPKTGAFNVTTALRQPGSSIKPIMYSLALTKGYTAATIISDTPVVFNIPGSSPYSPVNYDGRFHGLVPLRYALANSYNIPAVKVLSTIGVDSFIRHAEKMGISTWVDTKRYGLSLTLGGGEVKMTDMAVAFGVFANKGERVDLNPVISISDFQNNRLFEVKIDKKRVISEEVAFIISDILSDNFARRFAFGTNSALEIPNAKVAVKTGTTDEKKDNWTIGYTPQFLVAVWVGNNDNSPMNPLLASGVTGAAPVWNRVMSFLLRKEDKKNLSILPLPESEFKEPAGLIKKRCYFGKVEYFVKGTENLVSCQDRIYQTNPSPTP